MDNGESSYRRFLAGDEAAFDQILTEYRPSLTFFIQSLVRDPDAAEDICIDVFLELLLHPHRFNFRSSLKTYLFLIGRSRALNYLKRQSKLSPGPIPEDFPDGTSPEEQYLADEQKRAVHAALAQLPQDMRAALHLVYFEDLSYRETAKVMKKTEKQVDNLLYRGKERLRSILRKEGIQAL